MEMTKNLGLFSELIPGSPGLGHMPRAMAPEDSTDTGIMQRIQSAVQQGMISPQAAKFLLENMIAGQQETAQGLRGMPRPQNMPPMNQTEPHSMMRGLLGE